MARQPSPSSPAPVGTPLTRFQGLTATAIAESTSAYVVSEISNSLPKSGSNLIGHCPEDRILVFSRYAHDAAINRRRGVDNRQQAA
jgi:hypothetical protein